MDAEQRTRKRDNPRAKANFLSCIFFLYMVPIFYKGFKRNGLAEDDLFEPLDEHRSAKVGDELEVAWKKYNKKDKWALHKAIVKVYGLEFALCGSLFLLKEVAIIIFSPILIGKLVAYFVKGQTHTSETEAYYIFALLVLCLTLEKMVIHPAMMWIMHIAMKMRLSCSSVIYRKALRLSHTALGNTTIGKLVNMLSNDVSKFDQGFVLAHFSWVAPIQTAVGTYFLYQRIGVSSFFGVGFLLIFLPIQMWFGKRTSVLRSRIASKTDERVRLMNEIISGMQVIKMYTWEKPFAKLIALIRREEVKSMRAQKILQSLMFSFETFVARTAIFISLVSFVLLGEKFTASIVFEVTSIYFVMRSVITYLFSISISALAEVHVSLKRMQDFLSYEELPSKSIEQQYYLNGTNLEKGIKNGGINAVKEPKVILNKVCAKWVPDLTENTLVNISFEIKKSQLFAVIGPVGSGKSSILNVILKELPVNEGELEVSGSVSYAAQEPWLFAGSVRQNILFGQEYDEMRYKQVCKVCALESDFNILPYGDKSLVGENGRALSGGQKARVNLARCIYKEADIYLLDDPLSAVDTHVGKQLFRECIKNFLGDKIVVLITHQLQYLKSANNILILKFGEVNGLGTYKQLQSSGLDFAKLLEEMQTEEENVDKKKIKSRQNSVASESIYEDSEEEDDDPKMEKEKLGTGHIGWSTYSKYFRAGGNWAVIILIAFGFLLSQLCIGGADYVVKYWVNLEQTWSDKNSTSEDYSDIRTNVIYEYSGIILLAIITTITRGVAYFVFFMRASVKLHDYIFTQLLRATMRFFNNNPIGRILNRFSKDLGIMDEYIAVMMYDVIDVGLLLFGSIILTGLVDPLLLLPAGFMLVLIYFMRVVYLKTSRSVKRIEGATRSPIFGHMAATIQGLSTIRAFSAEQVLIKEFDQYQDSHSTAWYIFLSANRFFGFWLDMFCVLFMAIVILVAFSIGKGVNGGDMGLIITQYIGLMGFLQWGMRQWTELENQMVSVERILEYTKLENDPMRINKEVLPKEWPEYGKLEFRNLSMRYNVNDPPVLKDLNFVVHPKEKVGIVGRTGAGKSSIIVALFQLYEVEGSILIDDVDTTKMPLDLVRSKIAIIPQEPVLFSGTMRKNLDPFDEFDDKLLWSALEQVELKEVIDEMPAGLSSIISEGGANFSVGQRQLICLARAILRNNKILVLDEATANVDPHTDALIQQTIRSKFAECTVLTIAHRLHTVMDSDKILVMNAGSVLEFGHPYNLLQMDYGVLRDMVETTGLVSAKNLKSIAEKSHEESKNK